MVYIRAPMDNSLLEDRPLSYAELVARKDQLDTDGLLLALCDGRAAVRANAALGLAALGHTGPDLVPFLRDGHPDAGRATAEALAELGAIQRAHLPAIAAALDGARPEVVRIVVAMLATLVGQADAELVAVLDTSDAVAASAIIDACERVGVRGLHLLQAATRDPRARVRMHAVRGVGQLADLEPVSSFRAMRVVAFDDSVSDARAAARAAIIAFVVRNQGEAAARRRAGEPVPHAVPALHERALAADELRAAAAVAPADELRLALIDHRAEVRLNAVRVLALQGPAAAGSTASLAVATRDGDPTIRAESVRALGALGVAAVIAAPALVHALGDREPAVSAAAEAVIAGLGAAAAPALLDGLVAPSEAHGARVTGLLGRLADGPRLLREALATTSVDVRVNAALGLGALGPGGAGDALRALIGATSGGNARVRAAVARAFEVLAPQPDRSLPAIEIDGFEDRALPEPELARRKDALVAAGVAGLARRLADNRPVVRSNSALALGVLGDVPGVTDALVACLRDDAADVRMGAARALARLGEGAIAACAHDLVRALGAGDDALAAQIAATLRAHAHPAIDAALARGLDTASADQAMQVCELVCGRPAAIELLCEAFAWPGAQANVARGFITLGQDRLAEGRALLERARTDSSPRVRELARATLLAIDGVPVGPPIPAVPGFETEFLERNVLAKAPPFDVKALVSFVADGRAPVRANAATALGTLGPAAASSALAIAVLLRDDDDRVRIAAARAIDQLGEEAVVAAASDLVGGLGGDARVAEACHAVLAAHAERVEAALVAGLETADEVHGMRVADLICTRPGARELLFRAFDGEAQNVQINAAFGIAKLGAKRAGAEGRQRLLSGLPGPLTRRRDAMIKALAMLGPDGR